MTMVPVTWSNLKTDERLFVVYHRAIPLGCEGLAERAMLIPDRWGKYVPSGRCLMTEASRRALDYQGEGVAVAELPPLTMVMLYCWMFIPGGLRLSLRQGVQQIPCMSPIPVILIVDFARSRRLLTMDGFMI